MINWQQTGWKNGRPTFAHRAEIVTRARELGNCRAFRDGQEAYCPCGLRWSLDEDRPECGR